MTVDYNPTESARLIAWAVFRRGNVAFRPGGVEPGDEITRALAGQLEAAGREIERLTNERDRVVAHGHEAIAQRDDLRQQLEASQRECERAADEDTERYRLRTDLAAAQKRIEELEAESAAQRASKMSWKREAATAQSVIGTIWPVLLRARAWEDRYPHHQDWLVTGALREAIDSANAALTPEILAALKSAGLEIE